MVKINTFLVWVMAFLGNWWTGPSTAISHWQKPADRSNLKLGILHMERPVPRIKPWTSCKVGNGGND
jgi:hypothetical protein